MNLKSAKIIAVDFDGTLCENKWPETGEANKELIDYLRDRQKNGDKLILWTCRVDDMLQKAIEWCKEKELIFDAVNENLPEIIENFGSDTRKIFANEYIDDRNIWPLENGVADVLYLCDGKSCGDTCPGVECKHTSDIAHARNFIKGDYDSYWEKESEIKEPDSHEKSSMELWAEREVEIACKHEAPDRKPGEWDYGCACYESALKAFRSLCEDGHSGFSISMTKFILNRLIEGKPLTSIEDTEDAWSDISDRSGLRGEIANYQCRRMSSLFKYGKDPTEDFSRYRYLMQNYKNRIDQLASMLTSNIRAANSIYPTTLHEYEKRRDYQNTAIVNCEQLLKELQRIVEIFEVDVNLYSRYVKAIDREIGLIKKWRQRDNRIKSQLRG